MGERINRAAGLSDGAIRAAFDALVIRQGADSWPEGKGLAPPPVEMKTNHSVSDVDVRAVLEMMGPLNAQGSRGHEDAVYNYAQDPGFWQENTPVLRVGSRFSWRKAFPVIAGLAASVAGMSWLTQTSPASQETQLSIPEKERAVQQTILGNMALLRLTGTCGPELDVVADAQERAGASPDDVSRLRLAARQASIASIPCFPQNTPGTTMKINGIDITVTGATISGTYDAPALCDPSNRRQFDAERFAAASSPSRSAAVAHFDALAAEVAKGCPPTTWQ